MQERWDRSGGWAGAMQSHTGLQRIPAVRTIATSLTAVGTILRSWTGVRIVLWNRRMIYPSRAARASTFVTPREGFSTVLHEVARLEASTA